LSIGSLFISHNLEKAKEEIYSIYKNIVCFESNEIKLEDVKAIKEEAYKTTDIEKHILIKANKFHYVSQNAILKLLEEPPENINFLLLTTSKYSLFDTIKSRLVLKEFKFENEKKYVELNVNNLQNKDILGFVKENKNLSKEELKEIVYSIFHKLKRIDEDTLLIFEKVIKLIESNTNKEVCISLLLLAIRRNNFKGM
jgi:DNA polymerase-3 subunit delta'